MLINIIIALVLLVFSAVFALFNFEGYDFELEAEKLFSNGISGSFLIEITTAILVIIFTHIALASIIHLLSRKIERNKIKTIFTLWFLIGVTIISFCSIHFPGLKTSNSFFASEVLLIINSLILLFISLLLMIKNEKKAFFGIVVFTLSVYFLAPSASESPVTSDNKKAVFIIGIDSLRPDFLRKGYTPNIDQFLESSLTVPETYTPAGRTFSAWTSILTGSYPTENGARFNLTKLDNISVEKSIAFDFKQHQYTTIYAQDERRFNNIDETFGFDFIIGPPATAAEFVLSKLGELPLIAVLTQLDFFHQLFPYTKGNRAAFKTYNTFDFNSMLKNKIMENTHNNLFVASHFTLPHYPFLYSKPLFLENEVFDKEHPYPYLYKTMLQLVDKQIDSYLKFIKESFKTWDVSIIILSDHGESLDGLDQGPQPRFDIASFETNTGGHGTNVLSLVQYNVLLAINSNNKQCMKHFSSLAENSINSLVDIKSNLKCVFPKEFDLGEKREFTFLESSLNPIVISKNRIDQLQTIANGIKFYEIANNGKMIVKEAIYTEAIAAKQRAVLTSDKQLAIFPDIVDDLILIDRKDNTWMPASMYTDKEEVRMLFYKLCDHFEQDTNAGLLKQCEDKDSFLSLIYQKWNS